MNTLNTNVKTVSPTKKRTRAREREMPLAKATHDRVRPKSFLSLSLFLCDSVSRREKEFSSSR